MDSLHKTCAAGTANKARCGGMAVWKSTVQSYRRERRMVTTYWCETHAKELMEQPGNNLAEWERQDGGFVEAPKEAGPCSDWLGVAFRRAEKALSKLADAYERSGAEALARETRCIITALTARNTVLCGGATPRPQSSPTPPGTAQPNQSHDEVP